MLLGKKTYFKKWNCIDVLIAIYAGLLFCSIFPVARFDIWGFSIFPSLLIVPLVCCVFFLSCKKVDLFLLGYVYLAVLFFVFVSVISGITWSGTPTKWLVFFIVVIVFSSSLRCDKSIYAIAVIATLSIVLICIYGLYEYVVSETKSVAPFWMVAGNRNTLSLWTLGVFPLTLSLGIENKVNIKHRFFWLTSSVVIILAQIFSFNRSSWVILAISFAAVLLSRGVLRRDLFRIVIFMVLFILGIYFFVSTFASADQKDALNYRFKQLTVEHTDGDEFRLLMIGRSFELVSQSPFFGVGFGKFDDGWVGRSTVAHNIYLLTLGEQGILGLILLLLGLLLFLNSIIFCVKRIKDPVRRSLGIGLLFGIVALVLRGSTSDMVFFTPIAMLIFALSWSFVKLHKKKVY